MNPATNIERLRVHLEDGTLAAKLVDTYRNSAPEKRIEWLPLRIRSQAKRPEDPQDHQCRGMQPSGPVTTAKIAVAPSWLAGTEWPAPGITS